MIDRLYAWFDSRLGTSRFLRSAVNKIFPDNWSFMIGEIAFYALVVLIITGTFLTFFFEPSGHLVTYGGGYGALRGVRMSEAYRSTIRLSFDVRAGLVIRQMHHWAALVFIGAIVSHLCRIFFTGAFRRPREVNWIIGLTLFLLALFNGFSGYSLPDDLLPGTGLRIAYSVALGVPVIGSWIAFLVFGGEFPSPDILSRLLILHVLIVPALLVGLLSVHLAIVWRQKHTQFPGPGRTEDNIVGSRLWPTYALKSLALFAATFAVIALLGGLVQINPVWLYGPFEPSAVTTAAQPDWYLGWLEGALRLFPAMRLHLFGYTISEVFWPGVVLPGITFGVLYAWPFLEARVTGDRDVHELLDRPRHRHGRTAIGVSVLAFYLGLFVAGSQDLGAQALGVPQATLTNALRAAVLVLPAVAGAVTWKLCRDLAGAEALEERKAALRAPEPADAELPAEVDAERSWTDRVAAAVLLAWVLVLALLRRRRPT